MNEADKALKVLLDKLHTAEIELELAAALNSDVRLDLAEIALHNAILKIERVRLRETSDVFDSICRTDSYGAPR